MTDAQEPVKTTTQRTLYAVAVEIRRLHGWEADIRYLHADSQVHARAQFTCAHPNLSRYRIVGIAPAVGYFVEDKNGIVLSAG